MKKKTTMVLVAAALAVTAMAALWMRKPDRATYTLTRKDIDYSILASCTVSFPEPYSMTAKAEGDVTAIPVREGRLARRGDLLVQLDDFREKQNLAIARNNYESARLKLVNAREEGYPRLHEQLNDAAAALAEAQNSFRRSDTLLAAGAISRVEWEKAKTRLDSALARHNQVKLQVDSYQRSGAAAELINQLGILGAQVELARRAVAERRFLAPYDCTVVALDVERGETVPAGGRVVTVLEKKPWLLEASVDQKELGFLEVGLPGRVVFDAFPAEPVRADISLVCSVIDFAKGTCTLRLQVVDDQPFIKHGMTGSVEIVGKRRPGVNVGVLALPAEYVVREAGGHFALLVDGRTLRKVAVTFTPIGEKWVSVTNLGEGTRLARPQ